MSTAPIDLSRLGPEGGKRSGKRDRIVDVFLRQEGHLSADDLVVSEAGASTVSSYRLGDSGLDTISASLPVGFGAACWVAVSPNGKFAYTGNASGSISGFGIGTDGTLSPIGTTPTPSPRDLDFSRRGHRGDASTTRARGLRGIP